jgi:hypothetical protein
MTYVWGKSSQDKIAQLDPRLQHVLNHYITFARHDSTIVEGRRTDEQCFINFGKGRTGAQCLAGGCPAKYAQPGLAKVTWLGHALSSNHRGGKAVDLYPYPVSLVLGRPDAEWMPLFKDIAEDMKKAAGEVGVKIRWGADWDGDGKTHERGETDNPHFEVVG